MNRISFIPRALRIAAIVTVVGLASRLLWLLGLVFAGAGHGTYFLYALGGAPLGYFYWVWPAAVGALLVRNKPLNICGLVIMAVHYVSFAVTALQIDDLWRPKDRVAKLHGGHNLLLWVGLYCACSIPALIGIILAIRNLMKRNRPAITGPNRGVIS